MQGNIISIAAALSLLIPCASGFGLGSPCCPTEAPKCPPPPPPPAPCPPPPAYVPCPPPPPPPPPPCPAPPSPPPPPPPPPAENDCCSACEQPCRFKTRRRALGAKISKLGDVISLPQNVNAVCNSEELRNIMRVSIVENTRESKLAIQKEANEKLEGNFSVICATGEFSYVVKTSFFCQETIGEVTCYAFRLD
uniref:Ground-like domain-containing protein n=1 Tax=Plectus sambesii TaxID=2011161 RepID=A0A914W361_9BILA